MASDATGDDTQGFGLFDRMMNDYEQEQFMKYGQSQIGHPDHWYTPEELQELEDEILDEME